jgi:hypothetical protein
MARGFRTSQAIAMTTAVTTAGIPAASKHHLNPAGKVNWISLVLSYQH